MIRQCALPIWGIDMFQFINTILIGITTGSIYSLMAIAIVLIWRSTRVINFAQAALALFSTYIGYEVVSRIDSFWVALPVAMLAGALIAAVIELALMRPLLRHTNSGPIAAVAPIIASLGLLGIIRAITAFIWGGQDVVIKAPLSNIGFSIGEQTLVFSPMKLMIIISVLILVIALTLLFQKTNLGLSLRASAFSPEIARLSGIRVDFIRTLGWSLSGAVGAVAGLLQVANSSGSISPDAIDFAVLLAAGFITAVIGGLDSLVGAVISGLIYGIILSFVLMYVSSGLYFITPLVILIVILILRPQGIFGMKASRRA